MTSSEGSGEITVESNGGLGGFEEEGMMIVSSTQQISRFPGEGLRVLLVDDDRVSLAIVSQMLKKCAYRVTATSDSREALILLKKKVVEFDIVFTNVQMDEIDGFKMLEAGLELDLPVVMMSSDDNTNVIMKGIRHGARDYLIKPLRMAEIKNIWQHIYRKNVTIIGSPRAVGGACGDHALEFRLETHDNDVVEDANTTVKRRGSKNNKRKKLDEDSEEAAGKRDRIKWLKPLHDKFMDAVEKAGGPMKAVPKQILEAMGIDYISREQIASHLQKCRKNLTKKQDLLETRNNNNNYPGFFVPPPPPPRPPQLPNINNYQQFRGYHPNNNNMINCPVPPRQFRGYPQPLQAIRPTSTMMPQLPHHQIHTPIGSNNFQPMIMRSGNYNYNNNYGNNSYMGGQDWFNSIKKIQPDDHGVKLVNPEPASSTFEEYPTTPFDFQDEHFIDDVFSYDFPEDILSLN